MTVQSQNPNSAMTIASLKVTASNHWSSGVAPKHGDVFGNTNITLSHNLHTDGQFSLAPTNTCYPDGPTYYANANVVIDHSEFTHYNETNGGKEEADDLRLAPDQHRLPGHGTTGSMAAGAGSAAASSCSDGIDGLGDPYGVLIQGNEFSQMIRGVLRDGVPRARAAR